MSKILDINGLREKGVKYSGTHLRRLVQDGKFPAPFKFGDDPRAHKHWHEDEIDEYIARRRAAPIGTAKTSA